MKRWPAFLLILALFTCIGTGQAGGAEGAMIEVPCGREGVEEFMTAFARICPKGTLDGYRADEEHCFNVTPENVAQETDIRIFKFSNSCRSFVLVEGEAYDLGVSIGGPGFLNAVPWDYDGDGQMDILAASSWGSGLGRSDITVFNRASKTAKVIYTTLHEQDPQVYLTVRITEQGSVPEVILEQVKIVLSEEYDFAHLTYQVIGQYFPTKPFVTRIPPWNGDATASPVGSWQLVSSSAAGAGGLILDGEFDIPDHSVVIIFREDGSGTLREISSDRQQNHEISFVWRNDGDSLVFDFGGGDGTPCPFSAADDILLISVSFPFDIMIFVRVNDE